MKLGRLRFYKLVFCEGCGGGTTLCFRSSSEYNYDLNLLTIYTLN
jgi:hypothetical protein